MTQYPSDILYWLATTHVAGIGFVSIKKWLERFPLKKMFLAAELELLSLGLSRKQIQSINNIKWDCIEKELIWCKKNNCELIPFSSESYPSLLREIQNPPLILFVQGNLQLLSQRQFAIVGSRNPSVSGREQAFYFASQLAERGLTITSGLALGIDAAAHQGALHVGGNTIAVLGTGLGYIYPSINKKLANDIKEKGALVTEFSPFTPPRANNFPLRNRLISGLSTGVLVVEAALRSGSLITARIAGEQGRDVFAMPGSIHNTKAKGCHHLIKQGAKLVETVSDILEELNPFTAPPSVPESNLHGLESELLEQIGYDITAIDAIILRSGLTANEVSSMLLSLELKGSISLAQGGYVRNR